MDLIPNKETLSIEFKSDRKTISDTTIADAAVALSNTDGGTLFIGVEDDGTITGAQPQHRDPIKMNALIATKTAPPLSVRSTLLSDLDVPVMQIEIPRSTSVVASSDGRILRRRIKANGEPESIPMYPYEISTRLSDLGKLDLSAQPVPDTSYDDFNPTELEHLRTIIRTYNRSDKTLLELTDEELEKALGLTAQVGEVDVPTLAGLLLIGHEDSLAHFVPTYEAAFQVLEGTDIKVNETYRKPLLYTIEKIVESIEPWNPVVEIQTGLFSEPVPEFNKRAIREAIVNAFGHRDYSTLGMVRVLIDDDGLTISNPGGFIEGISASNLLTADPRGRNPRLMDALKRIGLAERTGRGVDRIYEGSLLYGRPLPDYSESNQTKVSLFIARSAPDISFVHMLSEESNKAGTELSLQSLMILDALKRFRRATMEELRGHVDIQSTRLHQGLEKLVEMGMVEASGSGASRSYTLSSKVYRKTGRTKEYVRQTDINKVRYPELILKLANEQGRVTTRDVSDLLHIERPQAYYEIRKLAAHNELVSAKRGRDAYYVPVSSRDN